MIKKGYTLIEILIVISISSILFTIGFLGFQSYSRNQAFQGLIRSLKTDLNVAKQSAIAGSIPSSCNGYLNGYQFKFLSTTSYEIDANCTLNTVKIKQVTIPSDFTITIPAINPVIFKSIAQGTNITSTTNIVIKQLSTGNTQTLILGSNGNIQ